MPLELAKRLLARERSAVSDALNLVDDSREAQRQQAREPPSVAFHAVDIGVAQPQHRDH